MAAIGVEISIDVGSLIRTAVKPGTTQKLGDPAGFFMQGDKTFILTVTNNGADIDLTTLAPNLVLSFSSIEDPDSPALVIGNVPTVSGVGNNILTFDVSTATVELQDYLEGLLSRDVIMELIDYTDTALPVVCARWVHTAINQGFTQTVPLYANLQHKLAINPDRQPLPSDDESEGYSLGSIWLYHNLANPLNSEIWIYRGNGQWDLLAPSTGGVGNFQIVQVPFAFNSGSPLTLLTAQPGDVIVNASVDIINAYDVPATVSIGTPADNNKIVAAANVDPNTPNLYIEEKNTVFALTETINLYQSPGASTQGNGLATVYINRA
jgi:hypothetical protein